jgi:UDP-N-acetylmuramate dehydrogenase
MLLREKEWREAFADNFQGEVGFDVPMKGCTSLGIGGEADVLATPGDLLSLRNLLAVLKEEDIPFFPLGGGSNIIVSDKGIEGVVISLRGFRRIEVLREKQDRVELFVESGVPLQKLVNFCREKGYSGIEGLTGIPGTVGGAICGNAGSFGCEMKDVVVTVAIMGSDAKLQRLKAEGLGFAYRKSDIAPSDIILSANLTMKKDDEKAVASRTEGFFREKTERQPISERSAGCVFKNPEGTSAGRLIEEAGCKGMRVGDIEVSPVHANFFINRGGGTAEDYLALMNEVATVVQKRFGISLVPEIKVVGRKCEGGRG